MGARVVTTAFGGSQRSWELRGMGGISVLPHFIPATAGRGMDSPESKKSLRARTGAEVQVLILWRCPCVPPWIHQRVLVSNLLGMGWDGWDGTGPLFPSCVEPGELGMAGGTRVLLLLCQAWMDQSCSKGSLGMSVTNPNACPVPSSWLLGIACQLHASFVLLSAAHMPARAGNNFLKPMSWYCWR